MNMWHRGQTKKKKNRKMIYFFKKKKRLALSFMRYPGNRVEDFRQHPTHIVIHPHPPNLTFRFFFSLVEEDEKGYQPSSASAAFPFSDVC